MSTNSTATIAKGERVYSAGLRANKGKTVADLLDVIRSIAGTNVLTHGKTSVQFRANAAAKNKILHVAKDFCVVGVEAIFEPARRIKARRPPVRPDTRKLAT